MMAIKAVWNIAAQFGQKINGFTDEFFLINIQPRNAAFFATVAFDSMIFFATLFVRRSSHNPHCLRRELSYILVSGWTVIGRRGHP
jgi:hypothetical protein